MAERKRRQIAIKTNTLEIPIDAVQKLVKPSTVVIQAGEQILKEVTFRIDPTKVRVAPGHDKDSELKWSYASSMPQVSKTE